MPIQVAPSSYKLCANQSSNVWTHHPKMLFGLLEAASTFALR
jgi:hypothetical protein